MIRLRLCQALIAFLPGALFSAVVPAQSVDMPVSFADVVSAGAAPDSAQFAYGPEASQYVRFWRAPPSSEPAPVVVLVHGGCWLEAYDVAHIAALASALAAEGFAVWAPEYRRVGEAGGGWPGSAEDLLAALQALQAQSPTGANLQQVLLVGHSAGGQLALWAAAALERAPLNGLRVRGVLGLAAITDLDAYALGSNSCQRAAAAFLGGLPQEVPAHYAAASPHRLTLPPATMLLHGDADPIVPLAQAHAIPQGAPRVIAGAGHFDLVHPGTAAFPVIVQALHALLEQP